MAEEPTARVPLDAIGLQSFTDEELQSLSQLIISERERRMGLEPGPKTQRSSVPVISLSATGSELPQSAQSRASQHRGCRLDLAGRLRYVARSRPRGRSLAGP